MYESTGIEHYVFLCHAGVLGHDSAGGPALLPLLHSSQPLGWPGLGVHQGGAEVGLVLHYSSLILATKKKKLLSSYRNLLQC